MKLLTILTFVFAFYSANSNAQHTASKQVDTFTIEAPHLKTNKKIWVYLPKSYKTSTTKFPVVYMHDAQNIFDAKTSYIGEWKVDEYLDSLATKQAIIVAIEHGNEKRIDELTPFKNDKYGGGQGNLYLDFIIYTLKPHIDATFRTKSDAKNTTIMGSSLGGLLSFYAIVKYPGIFGNAGVFSPSFWYSDKIYDLVKNTKIPETSRFYFLVGSEESEDMVPNQIKMIALLKENGINEKQIKNLIIEGGKHNEALWSNNFGEAFEWLIEY